MREALALRSAEFCNAEFMRFKIRELGSWDSGKRLTSRLIVGSNRVCLRRHPIHMQQPTSRRLSADSPHVFVSTPRCACPGVHKLVLDCACPTDELIDEANSLQQLPGFGEGGYRRQAVRDLRQCKCSVPFIRLTWNRCFRWSDILPNPFVRQTRRVHFI